MLSPIQRKYSLHIAVSQNFNYFLDKDFIYIDKLQKIHSITKKPDYFITARLQNVIINTIF